HRVERLRAHLDRPQRVRLRVIMIESARQPFAFIDGEIELELVTGAARRIRPQRVRDERIMLAEVEFALPFGYDPSGPVEKARKLGKRDRSPLIEAAGGMPIPQLLCQSGRSIGRCSGRAWPVSGTDPPPIHSPSRPSPPPP